MNLPIQSFVDKVRGAVLTDWVIVRVGVVCGACDNYNEFSLGDYD